MNWRHQVQRIVLFGLSAWLLAGLCWLVGISVYSIQASHVLLLVGDVYLAVAAAVVSIQLAKQRAPTFGESFGTAAFLVTVGGLLEWTLLGGPAPTGRDFWIITPDTTPIVILLLSSMAFPVSRAETKTEYRLVLSVLALPIVISSLLLIQNSPELMALASVITVLALVSGGILTLPLFATLRTLEPA
jgi:hypothetical protein